MSRGLVDSASQDALLGSLKIWPHSESLPAISLPHFQNQKSYQSAHRAVYHLAQIAPNLIARRCRGDTEALLDLSEM